MEVKMDMNRIKRLEQEVHGILEKNNWKKHPIRIDGYSSEYFRLKNDCERYERLNDRGFELTMKQWEVVRTFRKIYGKS